VTAAVLFDFGGTLDAAGVPWKERAYRLYRGAGVSPAHEGFDPVFYRVDDGLVGALDRATSFRETVTRLFAGLTDALAPGQTELASALTERFLADAAHHAKQSAAVLAGLRPRYRLGVVSNFYGNLATVCDDLGLMPFLDVVVDSECVGCSKPDRRIFDHALQALGVAAQDATFVGDSPTRDMAGARDLGMRHIWLVGEGETAPAPCCAGDPVIRSLDELGRWL
jgi:putative hydrolase of the HAD superfamily